MNSLIQQSGRNLERQSTNFRNLLGKSDGNEGLYRERIRTRNLPIKIQKN